MIKLRDVIFNPFSFEGKGVSMSYALFCLLLFLANPTLALVFAVAIMITDRSSSKRSIYIFYFVLAGWLGVLNMTKQLFSDQIYYADIFVHADVSNPLKAVIDYRPDAPLREPIFNLFSVICRMLVGPNPRAYFFICTFVFYILHFLALDKVLRASNRSNYEIILAVVFVSFFMPLYMQSVHALRQNLAICLIVYAIAYRASERRNLWLFLVMAFFMHNMSAFYIALALIPWLYEKLTIKRAFILMVGFSLFMLCYYKMGVMLSAADMAGMKTVGNAMTSNGDQVGFYSFYTIIVYALPTLIAAAFVFYRNRNKKAFEPIITLAYVYILTFMMILVFSGHQTLQVRYSFCLYSFMPFVLLLPFNKISRFQMPYCSIVTGFFTLRFFFRDMNWSEFASWSEILTSTFIHFWNTTYYNI